MTLPIELPVTVIASGSAEDNRSKAQEHGIEHLLLDSRHAVASSYESNRTPAAVIIRPDGTIGSALTGGTEAIRRLMSQLATTPPPVVGNPAPVVSLPDLEGRTVTSADFAGRELMLLFWRPGCGFCQRMLPELRAWLNHRAEDDPAVVLVSSESVEANRAMEIDVPILLDDRFATGQAFGARGTPSVVLIASDGTIASEVTVGSPAIMGFLGKHSGTQSRTTVT